VIAKVGGYKNKALGLGDKKLAHCSETKEREKDSVVLM